MKITIQLIAIALTTAIAFFAILKEDFFKKHKKKLAKASMVALSIAFLVSIYLTIEQEKEADKAENDLVTERTKAEQRANNTIAKMDVSLDSVKSIQNSAQAILSNIKQQITFQEELNTTANSLAKKNQQIIESQREIYKNTERVVNPLFPLNIEISFEKPFAKANSSLFSNYDINVLISKMKDYLNSNYINRIKGATVQRDSKSKEIKYIFIEDIDSLFFLRNNISLENLFIQRHPISLIKKSKGNGSNVLNTQSQMHFSLESFANRKTNPCSKIVNSLIVDFESSKYFLLSSYYDCKFVPFQPWNNKTLTTANFGIKDLEDCDIVIGGFWNGTKLNAIALQAATGSHQSYYLRFDNSKLIPNNEFTHSYTHKITRKDVMNGFFRFRYLSFFE